MHKSIKIKNVILGVGVNNLMDTKYNLELYVGTKNTFTGFEIGAGKASSGTPFYVQLTHENVKTDSFNEISYDYSSGWVFHIDALESLKQKKC
jgi:hypothetical protein